MKGKGLSEAHSLVRNTWSLLLLLFILCSELIGLKMSIIKNCSLHTLIRKQSNPLVTPPPPCQRHSCWGQVDTLSSLSCSSVCSWAVFFFLLFFFFSNNYKVKKLKTQLNVLNIKTWDVTTMFLESPQKATGKALVWNSIIFLQTAKLEMPQFMGGTLMTSNCLRVKNIYFTHRNLGVKKRMTRSTTYAHTFCFISYLWISGVFIFRRFSNWNRWLNNR